MIVTTIGRSSGDGPYQDASLSIYSSFPRKQRRACAAGLPLAVHLIINLLLTPFRDPCPPRFLRSPFGARRSEESNFSATLFSRSIGKQANLNLVNLLTRIMPRLAYVSGRRDGHPWQCPTGWTFCTSVVSCLNGPGILHSRRMQLSLLQPSPTQPPPSPPPWPSPCDVQIEANRGTPGYTSALI